MIKRSPSKLICIGTIILYCYLVLAYPLHNVLSYDVFGYYLYLPQFFIYNDPGISDTSTINEIINTYHNTPTFYQAHITENGNHIIQYPFGMAILFLPFFLIGHGFAYLLDYPADGFSCPYQLSFIAGYLTYSALAIFLIRKILLLYYNEKITSISLAILFFGTNFYQTAIGSVGMPHMYLFVLFSMIILLTHKWYQNPSYGKALLLGITIGLMSICRPTEFIVVLIPLFFGIMSFSEILSRIRFFLVRYRVHFLLTGLGILVVSLLQLIFWKIYTGNFLYYSYNNAGEGFNFDNPQIINFLFSFRKGWFIYTPVMFLALFGFYNLYRKRSPLFYPVLFFLLINIYVLSSWSCWWYAGSFSQRSVVQSYPVMTILIASLISSVLTLNTILRATFFFLLACLTYLNIFQTWQIHNGIIDISRMTKEYYMAVFGKSYIPEGAQDLLLINRPDDGIEIFEDTSKYEGKWIINPASEKICIDETTRYSETIQIPFKEITQKDHAWLKISCEFKLSGDFTETLPTIVRTFTNYKGYDYKYRALPLYLDTNRIIQNQWLTHNSVYLTPEVRSINDRFSLYVWIRGKGRVCIKNIKVRAYEKK